MQLEPLVFTGKHLADELVAALAAEGRVCTRLVVTAETEHGERSERAWYRAAGLSAPAMVERVRWQLDGWTSSGELSAGVVLLRLAPDEVRGDGGDQLRLWGGPSAADERATRAVARLAGLVGDQAVLVPAWRGGRLPGDRYGWVPASTTDLTDADDTAERLRPPSGTVARLAAGSVARRRAARGAARRGARCRRERWCRSAVGARSAPRRPRWRSPAGHRRRSPGGPARGRSTSAGGSQAGTAVSPASRSSRPTAPPTSSSPNAATGGSRQSYG